MEKSFSQILMAKSPDLDNELKKSQHKLAASEKKLDKMKMYLLQEMEKRNRLTDAFKGLSGLYARQGKRLENIKISANSGLKTIRGLKTYLKIKEKDLKRVQQVLFEAQNAIAKARTQNQAFDGRKTQMKEQSGRLDKIEVFARKKLEFYISGSSKIPEVKQKIANKVEENDALMKEIQEVIDKQNNLKVSIDQETKKLIEIQSEIDKVGANEQELRGKIQETTNMLKEQERKMKEITEQKAKLTDKLTDQLQQIHDLTLKSRELDDKILEVDMKNLEKDAAILDENERLNTCCAAINETTDELDQQLEAVNKELDEINEKIKENPIEKLDEMINIVKEKLAKIQGNGANTRTPRTPKGNSIMTSPLPETRVGDWLRNSSFPSGQVSDIDWSLYSDYGRSPLEKTPSPDHPKKTPHSSPERPPSSRSSKSSRSSRSSRSTRSKRSSRGSQQSPRSAKVRKIDPDDSFCEVSSTYLGE